MACCQNVDKVLSKKLASEFGCQSVEIVHTERICAQPADWLPMTEIVLGSSNQIVHCVILECQIAAVGGGLLGALT